MTAGIRHNGIILLNIFRKGTVTSQRYLHYKHSPGLHLSRDSINPKFLCMDNNSRSHKTVEVSLTLLGGYIEHMAYLVYSPNVKPT